MKLADVNTTSLRSAVELGCQTMSSVFNADDNDIPFFGTSAYPHAGFSFHRFHSESHVPGRHLNALLSAEDALGIHVDESVIEKHSRAAFFSYSGPVALPLNRETMDGPLINFSSHNIREGFHALYALTAYRHSERAQALAEASIAMILELWHPRLGWNRQRLENELGLTFIDPEASFVSGIARAIGPLIKYFRVTGSPSALHLATLLKDKALEGDFPSSGECDIARLGTHTHSITCVLSSLAQMAAATRDAALMERVKAFYDKGLPQISNALGWSPENARPDAPLDQGEANNTGDILETALLLGRWGYSEYYHDAERILRDHLLPSQLRDVSFISEPANPDGTDDKREIAQRHRGAFGFPAPYGHYPIGVNGIGFNMDVVGGVCGSLCAAYREATRRTQRGHVVNLLFDHETEQIKVKSPYPDGVLQIEVKQPAPVWIRIPPWVMGDCLVVHGAEGLTSFTNGNLYIPKAASGTLTLEMPLFRQEVVLRYKDRQIRAVLEGDQVQRMENFGTEFTFFDPLL